MSKSLTVILACCALSCARKAIDLQATPSLTPSNDPTSLGWISEQVGPIAVDDQRLYWMGNAADGREFGRGGTSLRSCEKRNCARSIVTYEAADAEREGSFGIANGRIYWIQYMGDQTQLQSKLLSCPVSGCASDPQVVTEAPWLYSVAYASEEIYLNRYRVSISGEQTPTTIPADQMIDALSVHGDYVYWVEHSSYRIAESGILRRAANRGTSSPETLAVGVQVVPYGVVNVANRYFTSPLAFDSSYVYWGQGTLLGSIDRCPLTGCVGAPEVVVAKVRSPLTIVIDGANIYWVHDSASRGFQLSTCTIGDCSNPKLISSGLDATNALAVDDQYVYTATTEDVLDPSVWWTNPAASIRRFPK